MSTNSYVVINIYLDWRDYQCLSSLSRLVDSTFLRMGTCGCLAVPAATSAPLR
ncbi:hypothetical protein DAPPUDRAFT_249107 [Daphnia pulex]|uniref:Uncharacterized protein n=1 Tax=Daphnia pulex TaxID=6669 RepID=E9GVV7_DAPPU|nr:hypothetical protein DAPPUDRAFT_249107 [Daphnia pulex]|eukprot:EFX76247.1 hypothetical protein DAPPUDRAFT_249107 [Daphnia pulex]